MGIQAFVPSGGGGTPGFDYIASVNMVTYNRSWSQSGAAGNYIVTSNNNNSGYVYFTNGASTTGGPLGKVIVINHNFNTINIIGPTGDFMSLYKASVKSTTVFANPFANFSSFPSTISSSGNFVLPSAALPLVDALVVGAGGSGGGHHAGGGGGGGGVVSLTGYQAVGTTAVTIGATAGHNNTHGYKGGTTYFGNVYALGGTGGSGTNAQSDLGANGGGSCGHGGADRSATLASNASSVISGFGTQSGTASYSGGYLGGTRGGSHAAGGGGGATGVGGNGSGSTPGSSGPGYTSSISGSSYTYSPGGPGGSHSPNNGTGSGWIGSYGQGGHGAHNGPDNNANGGVQGVVIVRYYIS